MEQKTLQDFINQEKIEIPRSYQRYLSYPIYSKSATEILILTPRGVTVAFEIYNNTLRKSRKNKGEDQADFVEDSDLGNAKEPALPQAEPTPDLSAGQEMLVVEPMDFMPQLKEQLETLEHRGIELTQKLAQSEAWQQSIKEEYLPRRVATLENFMKRWANLEKFLQGLATVEAIQQLENKVKELEQELAAYKTRLAESNTLLLEMQEQQRKQAMHTEQDQSAPSVWPIIVLKWQQVREFTRAKVNACKKQRIANVLIVYSQQLFHWIWVGLIWGIKLLWKWLKKFVLWLRIQLPILYQYLGFKKTCGIGLAICLGLILLIWQPWHSKSAEIKPGETFHGKPVVYPNKPGSSEVISFPLPQIDPAPKQMPESTSTTHSDFTQQRELPEITQWIEVSQSSDINRRMQAAEELGKLGTPAASALLKLLADPEPQVRHITIQALGNVGSHPPSREALAHLVENEQEPIAHRRDAALSLGKIGTSNEVFTLIQVAKESQQDEELRANAIYALVQIGDANVVSQLIHLLEDQSALVREASAKALGHFSSPFAIEGLLRLLQNEEEYPVQVAVIQALGNISMKANTSVPALLIAYERTKTILLKKEIEQSIQKLKPNCSPELQGKIAEIFK